MIYFSDRKKGYGSAKMLQTMLLIGGKEGFCCRAWRFAKARFPGMWDSNPQLDRMQPAHSHVVALFANSAALHGRCRQATLAGSIWLPLTLICNG